ncbi:MAG TPA: ADP-glyceromanno-heptose 6-epimerase [Candidatus Kapabacteria bacterium]|nr:ADP-glyceromanno-heptose 6-epimerase [Candidatus Kapabacteria bacterium]
MLVTGAAGFIGSCLLKKLNDEGVFDVLVVDYLENRDKWKNLVGKRFWEIVHPEEFLPDFINGEYDNSIETIVHLGATTATTERDADLLLTNNFHYTRDLAVHALDNDIRFIYASSAATYGLGENGYSDSMTYGLRPLNMYGYSKQLFDEWAKTMDVHNNMLGIKFFNVFGPNEYHKNDMASMIYKSYNQIKQSGKVKLFQSTTPEYIDGGQMRDFVYVKDCCDLLWHWINNRDIFGLYNLGTGKARSWNDLANAVFNAMDIVPNIEYVPMPDSLSSQYQNFTEADMTSVIECFPQTKFSSLEDAVNDYVRQHLRNSWQYW